MKSGMLQTNKQFNTSVKSIRQISGLWRGQKREDRRKKKKAKEKHLPGRPSQPTCIHLVEKVKKARISTSQRERERDRKLKGKEYRDIFCWKLLVV